MQDIRRKYVPAAVDQTAFNCPTCGAFATQFWFRLHAERIASNGTPNIVTPEKVRDMKFEEVSAEDRKRWEHVFTRLAAGELFLRAHRETIDYEFNNGFVSQCFNCHELAVWFYDRLAWPRRGEAPPPNPDLPSSIRADYDEASTILDLSPRGSAALLRLCVQKLCKELGERGANINDDIAALSARGLDIRVLQALDVVRVVGNSAVHPGLMDLKDDRKTAEQLFDLVNLIAEIMISQPKHVAAMFDGLPESAKKAIKDRKPRP